MSRTAHKLSSDSELPIVNLTKWWDGSVRFKAFAEVGKPEEDEERPEDEENADDGEDTKTDDTGKKSESDPRIKKLSDEAAARRVEAKTAAKERDGLAAKLKEYEDKDKSELEKAQGDLKIATDRIAELEKRDQEQSLRLAFYDSGAAAMLNKPGQAIKLMDVSTLERDDDGNYDHKIISKLVDDFVKENPHFAASGGSTEGNGGSASGREANGKRQSNKPTSDEILAKKFPALSGRI
jgi:hypothetical protein